MEQQLIRNQIDAALNHVVKNSDLIVEAVVALGIPIEDAIACAVRRALSKDFLVKAIEDAESAKSV